MFKSVMDYQRKHAKDDVKLYSSLSDVVSDTLCPLSGAAATNHNKSCIDRSCTSCRTRKIRLLPEKEQGANSDTTVEWQRFEYVDIGGDKRKLKIVTKETPVSEMFGYFLKLLEVSRF